MPTWTFKHLVGAALIAGLAGCAAPGPDAGRGVALLDGGLSSGMPPVDVSVLRGGFKVAGPKGFCVDKPSSRLRGDKPFVLLAPCERIRSGVAGLIFRPRALLTVTVTEGTGPTAEGYARFFADPAGLAALSRSGDPARVAVEGSAAAQDGSFRVTVVEDGLQRGAEALVDERSWRAFVTVNGHLLAVSLRSPRGAPLSAERAQGLLDETVAALRTVNPAVLETANRG